MNRILRRRHWRWVLVLVVVLPLLLVAFLGSRDFSSRDMSLPEAITEEAERPGARFP